MTPTLKPCPFCGEMPTLTAEARLSWVIRCSNAMCGVEPEVYGRTDAALVEAWNRRAPESALPFSNTGSAE